MSSENPPSHYQAPLFRTIEQLQAAWSLEVKICSMSVALDSNQPVWKPVVRDMYCVGDAESRRLFIVRECSETRITSTELIGDKGEVRSMQEMSPEASYLIYWKDFQRAGGPRWLPIPTWAWQQSPWRPELAERGSAEHDAYLRGLSSSLRKLAEEVERQAGI
jgi:hypothetical protein